MRFLNMFTGADVRKDFIERADAKRLLRKSRGVQHQTIGAKKPEAKVFEPSKENLFPAIEAGDDLVEFIANGIDLRARDSAGLTTLQVAIKSENTEAMQNIVKVSPRLLKQKDLSGKTPLETAIDCDNQDAISFIIQIDKNIDGDLIRALNHAREEGRDLTTINIFANPKKASAEKRTPLHIAAMEGNLEELEFLINKAVPEVFPSNTVEELDDGEAVIESVPELAPKLQTKLAKLLNKEDVYGARPLHYALINGHNDIVSYLIRLGADLNATDHEGDTPLHHAAISSNFIGMMDLIINGAELSTENKQGQQAFDLICAENIIGGQSKVDYSNLLTLIENISKGEAIDPEVFLGPRSGTIEENQEPKVLGIYKAQEVNFQDFSGPTPAQNSAADGLRQFFHGG